MIDVAIAIDEEAVEALWRARAPGGYGAGGLALPSSSEDAVILAALQPVSGSQLRDLPEGVRSEVTMMMWSRSPVRTDDEVVVDGESYRVYHVRDWSTDGFVEAAIGRLPQ